jgi:hypothetical protein
MFFNLFNENGAGIEFQFMCHKALFALILGFNLLNPHEITDHDLNLEPLKHSPILGLKRLP